MKNEDDSLAHRAIGFFRNSLLYSAGMLVCSGVYGAFENGDAGRYLVEFRDTIKNRTVICISAVFGIGLAAVQAKLEQRRAGLATGERVAAPSPTLENADAISPEQERSSGHAARVVEGRTVVERTL